MSVISSSKTQTAGSHTWGSGLSDSVRGPSVRRRRTKLTSDKKIADDEFMAAAIGDVEWLKQSLKDAGPEINFDKNGLTAIHLAAIHGRMECLKVCIEKFKIDINLASSTGWRPIHLCISNQTGKRSIQCLAYLLEKGADSSIYNDDGITPVHQAASEGHVQCLKMLLEVGGRIDGKDCRGNTPLDLAKLWGHRKCARILAAEMWHQDKDFVAKEMQNLKKIKMQQVLQELEQEEEMKAAQQFYGDEAFKQWMTAKNLTDKSAAQQNKKMDNKSGLMKPNSVRRQADDKILPPTKIKVSVDTQKVAEKPVRGFSNARELFESEDMMNLGMDENDNKALGAKVKNKNTKFVPLAHPSEWNKSTKARQKEYLPNLEDDFPRDEFTLMPRVKGMSKFYEGKFAQPVTPSNIDEDIKLNKNGKKIKTPDLPQEVVKGVLSKDSSISDRGMIFKCKHIGDVHAKKKYSSEQKGLAETPLHLTNDVKSYLVKSSVRLPKPKSTGSKTSSMNSHTQDLEWMTDMYPLPLVMHTMKQMCKPSYFHSSLSKEYELNFGDIK